MGRREENDGSRGRKSVSVGSHGGVEGWWGWGGGERRQGMVPEGCYDAVKLAPIILLTKTLRDMLGLKQARGQQTCTLATHATDGISI